MALAQQLRFFCSAGYSNDCHKTADHCEWVKTACCISRRQSFALLALPCHGIWQRFASSSRIGICANKSCGG